MNPSAAQLLDAVEALGAEEVVVLPNNGNVILTAEQAAGMSPRHVAVVPSTSIPVGLVAMVAFDPGGDAVGNARAMQDAIDRRAFARRSRARCATPSSTVSPSAKARPWALSTGALSPPATSSKTPSSASSRSSPGSTPSSSPSSPLSTGRASSRARLEELAARLTPDAEVHFHEGGQPLYPILASAE